MQVVAQRQEIIARNGTCEIQHRRAFTNPLPTDALVLRIVITNAQVLLKVALRVLQIRLRLWREHCR